MPGRTGILNCVLKLEEYFLDWDSKENWFSGYFQPRPTTSILPRCVPDRVLNITLLTYLMKSIWTQIFKISNAPKNHQISNHGFLFLIKDIHRKEIGSSVGGTFPTEPKLKQDPRNSTRPRTGIFPLRSETKEGFIYGIKIFFLKCSGALV